MVFLILWAFCQYLTWMIFHFDDLMILGMVSSILSILFVSCQYLIAWLVLEVVLVFGKSVSDSLTTTGGFCQFLDGYCWLLLDGVGGEVGLGSRAKLLQSSLGASPVPTYIHTPLALLDRHICQKQTVYFKYIFCSIPSSFPDYLVLENKGKMLLLSTLPLTFTFLKLLCNKLNRNRVRDYTISKSIFEKLPDYWQGWVFNLFCLCDRWLLRNVNENICLTLDICPQKNWEILCKISINASSSPNKYQVKVVYHFPVPCSMAISFLVHILCQYHLFCFGFTG